MKTGFSMRRISRTMTFGWLAMALCLFACAEGGAPADDEGLLDPGDGDDRVFWLEQAAPGQFVTHLLQNGLGQSGGMQLADLDGDGKLEIYVGSEDQGELRRYRFENGTFVKTVIAPLTKGDISWNVNDAKL